MKTSIAPQSSNTDLMRLYSGNSYEFTIKFANVAEDKIENICNALDYELIMPSSLQITQNDNSPSLKTKGTLQTIMPGKSREIKITVECNMIDDDYEFSEIQIKTEDYYGKTWDDSVSLKVNKASVKFNIKSENEINGVVIVPNGKAYHFKTSRNYWSSDACSATVEVPKYLKEYLVVFSGASPDTESKYSFAVDTPPDSTFDYQLSDVKQEYKRNTTEQQAAVVSSEEEVKAYLIQNSANYYKVRFSQLP